MFNFVGTFGCVKSRYCFGYVEISRYNGGVPEYVVIFSV